MHPFGNGNDRPNADVGKQKRYMFVQLAVQVAAGQQLPTPEDAGEYVTKLAQRLEKYVEDGD